MATTSTVQAATVSELSDGEFAWSNVANAVTDDDSYATFDGDGNVMGTGLSNRLQFTNFGFTGPGDADDVTDVLFEFATLCADNATVLRVQLVVGGSLVGSVYTINDPIGSTESWIGVSGSVVSDFGTTLTGAQLKASNFGVAVTFYTLDATTVSVDAARGTATYTPTGAGMAFQSQSRRVRAIRRM